MDEPQHTPTALEQRQASFQHLERGEFQVVPTKMNISMLLQAQAMLTPPVLVAIPLGRLISQRLIDWGLWRYVAATLVAGAAGIVTLFVAFHVVIWLVKYPNRRNARKVKNASDEELWQMVDREPWRFKSTIALLQLAIRGKDIGRAIPRIVKMLESKHDADRTPGSEAFEWVFVDEYRALRGGFSDDSYTSCHEKAAQLRASLEDKRE
jgi:hypothetical protein